jgi:hypothetical protein
VGCVGICACPQLAHGFDSLLQRVRPEPALANAFRDADSEADVQDGFLIGVGSERVRHLPDGRLSVERVRRYTSVRRSDTQAVAKLPEPWEATASILLEPTLRVIRIDTKLNFKRSGDAAFKDYKLSEKHAWLFEADRTLLRSVAAGRRLQLQSFQRGKLQKQDTYDYPADAIPLELVGMFLTVAVQRGVDHFDFNLLAPGGDVHGVRSQVTRTRDVRRFAVDYHVPRERLVTAQPVALVEMRLASPIKYLFFPHHFYMAFSTAHADELDMMWGGDPDTNLQAFRREPRAAVQDRR